MTTRENTIGWIDYVIASDEPADRVLAAEFAAN